MDPEGPGQTPRHVPDAVLTHLNRATTLTDLLPVVVHDLNNALLVIAGSVELLEDGALTESQSVRVGRIRAQQEKMAATLRTLARVLHAGTDDATRAECGAVVRQAVEFRRSASARRGIQVSVDGPAAPLVVGLDAGSLLQIVLNLLANAEAAAAGAASGERAITVTVRSDNGCAVLTVADTGPGVDGRTTGRLFEPFASHRLGTAGLGLAVSRHLAEQAGGTVTLLPGPAGGTRAELRVPVA